MSPARLLDIADPFAALLGSHRGHTSALLNRRKWTAARKRRARTLEVMLGSDRTDETLSTVARLAQSAHAGDYAELYRIYRTAGANTTPPLEALRVAVAETWTAGRAERMGEAAEMFASRVFADSDNLSFAGVHEHVREQLAMQLPAVIADGPPDMAFARVGDCGLLALREALTEAFAAAVQGQHGDRIAQSALGPERWERLVARAGGEHAAAALVRGLPRDVLSVVCAPVLPAALVDRVPDEPEQVYLRLHDALDAAL